MKTCILIILMGWCSLSTHAQTKPVKILFDVTSKDSLTHQAVLRHVQMMSSQYTDSKFEVVVYGGALGMYLKDKSTVSKNIAAVSNNKNVTFAVCSETMRRQNIDKSQLLPGIVVVPDAIMEIVTKQGEGWGYIKEAHH
jgi:intracellular sulfur oxidation DsrE/DsrF family protein